MTSPNLKRFEKYFVFFLFLSPFYIYLHSTSFNFVWDDWSFFVHNPYLHKAGFKDLIDHFIDPLAFANKVEAQIYRPLRNISYLIDIKLFGTSSFWSHLMNIFIHALNCLLFYLFLRACLNRSITTSVIATTYFSVHPLHTEVICWIKSRDDLLCLCFGLSSILLIHFYYCRKNLSSLFLGILSFTFSLLSKEAGSFLLFLLPLIPSFSKERFIFKKKLFLVLLLIFLAYISVRSIVLSHLGQSLYLGGGLLETQFGMSLMYAKYLQLLIIPLGQRINYMGWNPYDILPFISLFSIWVFLTILSFSFWKYSNHKGKVCLLFFILSLLPISNFIPMMQWGAERFLYFPSIFFISFLCLLLSNNRPPWNNALIFSMVLFYLLSLNILNISRQKIWRNNGSLGKEMLRTNPQSYTALVMLLDFYKQKQNYETIIQTCNEYIETNPEEVFLYEYLAFALLSKNEHGKAKKVCLKGLNISPRSQVLSRILTHLEKSPKEAQP